MEDSTEVILDVGPSDRSQQRNNLDTVNNNINNQLNHDHRRHRRNHRRRQHQRRHQRHYIEKQIFS